MYEAIKRIYPSIPDNQFTLQDDGNGPYIKSWDSHLPRPSQAQIDATMPLVLRDAAYARINAAYENAMNTITAGYPESEIKSWGKQELEARAWMGNHATPTPWIDAAAGTRRMEKALFVHRIITKATAFAVLHGELTGKRQRLEDQITALGNAPTQEQLDAIIW